MEQRRSVVMAASLILQRGHHRNSSNSHRQQLQQQTFSPESSMSTLHLAYLVCQHCTHQMTLMCWRTKLLKSASSYCER